MFLQLVWKEVKYQSKNITFYLFIAVVLMFYVSQFVPYIDSGTLLEPQPGMPHYGMKEIEDEEAEMKAVFLDMNQYYNTGYILKQSVLINKTVNLSEEQRTMMKEALDKLGYFKSDTGKTPFENIEIKVSYSEYLEIVRGLDKSLGGSTYYGDKYRKYILQQPMTYEDAMKEFENIKNKDKITNAYGRVFADYMGITAGLFPVFLSAFVLTKDRRSRMHELIYSRSISSFSYVAAKYLAILLITVVLYLLLAAHATYGVAGMAQQSGYAVDMLAFFKYTALWLVPTLMFSTAMGMFISIAIGNGVAAILVQFVLWFLSITSLGGNYEWYRNIIRFNQLGSYEKYITWLPQITANRIFYTVLSIAICLAAVRVFSLKRRAGNGFKSFKDNLVQHKDTV